MTRLNIQSDFFTFLRYTVASDNGFTYCINLNKSFLLAKGYRLEQLRAVEGTQKRVPLGSTWTFCNEPCCKYFL